MGNANNENIEIRISKDRKTVWMNGEVMCLGRACNCKSVVVIDESAPPVLKIDPITGDTYEETDESILP